MKKWHTKERTWHVGASIHTSVSQEMVFRGRNGGHRERPGPKEPPPRGEVKPEIPPKMGCQSFTADSRTESDT